MTDIDAYLKERGLDYWNQNTVIPSAEEKQRSRELHEHRRCPRCDHEISIADAISMVFGNGWDQPVLVQCDDGSTEWIFATKANPQRVRILGCLGDAETRVERIPAPRLTGLSRTTSVAFGA
jgi:hypothetical protein